MEISAREAARRLAAGHVLSREQSRRILAAGLAGPAHRTPGALLYEEAGIDALLQRPQCPEAVLDRVGPFIARIGRSRTFDGAASWRDQAASVAGGWYVPSLTVAWLRLRSSLGPGRFPFVATLGAWVVFGAEIVGWDHTEGFERSSRSRSHATLTWDLEPPGSWYDSLRETWLPIGDGPAWTVWGAPVSTPAKGDSLSRDYDRQIADIVLDAFSTTLIRRTAVHHARADTDETDLAG